MALPQGDPALLESEVARRLLASTIPARLAYTAQDGTPRVVPIWFHWTGQELVMASLAGAAKVAALRNRPDVAVTIDAEGFPPDVLLLRGPVGVTDVEGIVPEYAQAARRYLGDEGAADLTLWPPPASSHGKQECHVPWRFLRMSVGVSPTPGLPAPLLAEPAGEVLGNRPWHPHPGEGPDMRWWVGG